MIVKLGTLIGVAHHILATIRFIFRVLPPPASQMLTSTKGVGKFISISDLEAKPP